MFILRYADCGRRHTQHKKRHVFVITARLFYLKQAPLRSRHACFGLQTCRLWHAKRPPLEPEKATFTENRRAVYCTDRRHVAVKALWYGLYACTQITAVFQETERKFGNKPVSEGQRKSERKQTREICLHNVRNAGAHIYDGNHRKSVPDKQAGNVPFFPACVSKHILPAV